MDRIDFVTSRIDVVKNIYTLYSYVKSSNIEDREWALQRFKQGRWYVVESFGDILLFAPSRFVGYKDNTRAKHTENPGDGIQTNNRFYELKLYKETADDYLVDEFQYFIGQLGIEKNTAKFFIPYDLDVSDLRCRHKCYFVSPTHCEGQKEIAWKDFLTKGIIAIGWKDIDYSNKSIEDITQEYQGDADALSAFPAIKRIKSGDIICCTHNKYGLWGIGIATSSYKYKKGIHYAGIDDHDVEWNYSHYIEVAWLCYNKNGFIPTSDLQIQPSEKQWNPYGTLSQKEIPQYINRYILKDTNIMDSKKQYAEFIDLLRANKNLILTGAPGTGKTFLAREIANAMGAEFEFVQFHPSYDYTDFVEGLRPTPPDWNGNIGFERKDGVFKAFCKSAICSLQLYNDRKEQKGQAIDDGYEKVYTLSFKDVYQTIVDDIRTGKLTKTMGDGYKSYRLEIRKGRIWYENRFEKEDNIEKMYNDCLARGIYNIREWRKEDYWDLVNKVTDGKTSTVDYKIYGWILQELLKRTKQHQREFVQKGHPDIISSSQQEHSENDSCVQNKKDYVFIIDEINRGELSKIFGELFFSIDPGYRGKKGLVKTQYQNMIVDKEDPFYEGFYIPENVYIIGTMNDIDRSVESMDFAMRRRFAWKEIKANENTRMLDDLGALKSEVVEKMNRLNDKIWNEISNDGIEGLGIAYHIGGAYFRKLRLYLNKGYSEEEAYRALWENHLRGVLFEYLRGSMNAAESMRELEKAYYAES